MEQVVRTTNERDISSVLVFDDAQQVVGIITERDIVRKFTLLDVDDKLKKTVSTVMTRPVHFARLEHVKTDITRLFLSKRVRHFPILQGSHNHVDNIVGIVSLSDIVRHLLAHEQQGKKPPPDPTPMAVLTCQHKSFETYQKLFRHFNFKPVHITDFHGYIKDHPDQSWPVLFDLDGYGEKNLRGLIPVTKKYRGPLAMTTRSSGLVQGLRKFLDHEHQIIALKPLDISYLQWFFSVGGKDRASGQAAS